MSRSHHRFEVMEESGLGVPLVRVEGEVDLVSARELEAKVRLAMRSEAPGVALDLRRVTYFDALGIQALLNAGRLAKRQNKRLVLLDRIRPMRRELAGLWARSMASSEHLVVQLQDWCLRAEASGVAPLVAFSRRLRTYS